MAADKTKIRQCEQQIWDIAKEIAQFESELMSPDCNLEGIKERDAQMKAKQTRLQQELIELWSSAGK